jgi:AraC-like DNA-binding protein/transcriptional regulator with XRE-family HTH domain
MHKVAIRSDEIQKARERLGLSQGEFAYAFGVSASTLRKWEQGQRTPTGAAKTLLRIIEREPKAVERALKAAKTRRDTFKKSIMGLKTTSDCNPMFALLGPREAPFEFLELFDHLHDVLAWTKDKMHRFRWVNRCFFQHLGLQNQDQLIGRTDFDFFNAKFANQHRFDDEKVSKGERVIARIELVGLFDHAARLCSTTKLPLHDRRGRIVGTAGISYPLKGEEMITAAYAPLAPAMHFISKHYAKSIYNHQLAATCNLSVRAFERQFRRTYHTSPHAYIRQMRVRLSCGALLQSAKALAELAPEFGFGDQSHFTKEFRRFFGETPGAYRNRYSRVGKCRQ